nr:sigma 54-interacting transcriptional regulator [Hazenella coriacea]
MIQDFLERLDEGIHIVNADGFTIFYNQAASVLDGLKVDEVLGIHLLKAFPSLTPKTSTLLNVIQTGIPIAAHQQAYSNCKGRQIVTINKTIPLHREGEIVGAVEISKDITRMKELVEQVIDLQEQVHEPRKRKESKAKYYQFEDIITKSQALLAEIEKAKRASFTKSPVLVIGETGTGKELIVQSIHQHSPRRSHPFIAQNCAAIPATLLEGILFGTAKGAFTGAVDRPGLFELADGGTLFLDEIHAMPMDLQAKLLRVLEEEAVRRVGGTELRAVDVRIIVATNEDPIQSIQDGRLRRDLYYRIHVVGIQLPPLKERFEDIELLTKYFLQKMKYRLGARVEEVSPEVIEAFQKYHWPGNVRELEHMIEGACNLATGLQIELEHLPDHLRSQEKSSLGLQFSLAEDQSMRSLLSQVEKQLIQQALKKSEGNIKQAAKHLGIPRQTLQYKLKKIQAEA